MMAGLVRMTVLCALTFWLAGCGSKGKPTAAAGTIDKATATTLSSGSGGNQIITLASPKPSASLFGSNPSGTTRRALNLIPEYRNIARIIERDEDCDPELGDTTDADSDGIPRSQTMTFNCNTTSDSFTLVASGSISITDANDDDRKSGFSFKITNVKFVLTSTSAARATTTIEASINGEFTVTVAGTAITASGNVDTEISVGGKTIAFSYWGDTSATGSDEADPYAAGTITVNNWYDFEYEGTKYTLHITSQDLTYGTCARSDGRPDDSQLNGGKLIITDGVPNTIEVSFDSACNASWTYNGEAL